MYGAVGKQMSICPFIQLKYLSQNIQKGLARWAGGRVTSDPESRDLSSIPTRVVSLSKAH